jgi:hypothetical protein
VVGSFCRGCICCHSYHQLPVLIERPLQEGDMRSKVIEHKLGHLKIFDVALTG